MLKALFTSATGMKAQQLTVDVISNNIANANTSGFKRSQINFQDLLYVSLQRAGADVAQGLQTPTGFQLGSGVRAISTTKVFTPGVLQGTQRDLDVAIDKGGFFQVQLPDGSLAYTRDGALQRDALGNLVTSEGYRINPPITIPDDATGIQIGRDGTVTITTAAAPETPTTIGQIQLARFANPSGLEALGANLFRETAASGTATLLVPGTQGVGTLVQFFLEGSNVDIVSELVNLIVAQRAYEVNSRAIRTGDEMLSQTNALVQ
jgi:flagellar basal-body rod protein FlgG